MAEGPRALCMGLAVRNHLAVEVGHRLHQVVILQQNGAVGSYRERKFVAGRGGLPASLVVGLRSSFVYEYLFCIVCGGNGHVCHCKKFAVK